MMEYYLVVKRSEMLIHATIWLNLRNIMLSKRISHKRPHIQLHLYEICRIGKSIETKDK